MEDFRSEDIKLLFTQIAQGDQAAFDKLFHQFYDRIYSTALVYGKVHELAEDIAQQVFLQVWEKRKSLVNVDKPLAWLLTAARYAIHDAFDRQLVREKYRKMALATFELKEASAEEVVIRRQQLELVRKAVQSLTGRPAEVYTLARENGLTYEEIANTLGIGKESVKEYMATALKKIRSILLSNRDALLSLLTIFLW